MRGRAKGERRKGGVLDFFQEIGQEVDPEIDPEIDQRVIPVSSKHSLPVIPFPFPLSLSPFPPTPHSLPSKFHESQTILAIAHLLRYKINGIQAQEFSATEALIMMIWVNEQIDSSGIIRACIACRDQVQAQECHDSFENNLTPQQKAEGWVARMRTVDSWEEVPVNALKLD